MGFRNFYIKTIWRYCAHFSKSLLPLEFSGSTQFFRISESIPFLIFKISKRQDSTLKIVYFSIFFRLKAVSKLLVSWLNTSYENLRIYCILNMLGVMLVTLEGKYSSVLRSLLLFSFIFRNIASFSQLRSLDSRRLVHQSAKY